MTTAISPDNICARIASRLAERVGTRRYDMWFDRSAKMGFDTDHRRLDLAVPNRFVAEWIGKNFEHDLRDVACQEFGQPVELCVNVEPNRFQDQDAAATSRKAPVTEPADRPAAARPDRGWYTLSPRSRSVTPLRHKLEDFVVGPTNQLGHAAVSRLAEDDSAHPAPVFVHGMCGLGKTHLLQGLCRAYMQRHPNARVLYTTGEQFTNDFVQCVRAGKIEQFRKKIRALDLLAVDDVHFLAGKQATLQEFQHSFDAIDLSGARVALASDSHPRAIEQFGEALVSRCLRGMVVRIDSPDRATRGKIIRHLALRRNLSLIDSVVDSLAQHAQGSVREVEGVLTKLQAVAELLGDDHAIKRTPAGQTVIGHAMLAKVLEADPSLRRPQPVRFETIMETASTLLGVTRQQVLGKTRQRQVVLARASVAYLARQMTSMSFPEIAQAMGRPTHSTIVAAVQRTQRQIEDDPQVLLADGSQPATTRELLQRIEDETRRV